MPAWTGLGIIDSVPGRLKGSRSRTGPYPDISDSDISEPAPETGADPAASSAEEDARWIAAILIDEDAEAAYEALFRKYWKVIVGWIRPRVRSHRDAEAVAQEAFIKAFAALDRLESPRSFLAWLMRIAGNQTTDHLRRQRRSTSLNSLADGEASFGAEAGFEREAEMREELDLAMAAVSRLPEKYRMVLTMRYQLGLSAKTIAENLGEPEGTIRNRVFRALQKVRDMLLSDERATRR